MEATELIINGLYLKNDCDYDKCKNLQILRNIKCRNIEYENEDVIKKCKKIEKEIAICSKQFIECHTKKIFQSIFNLTT